MCLFPAVSCSYIYIRAGYTSITVTPYLLFEKWTHRLGFVSYNCEFIQNDRVEIGRKMGSAMCKMKRGPRLVPFLVSRLYPSKVNFSVFLSKSAWLRAENAPHPFQVQMSFISQKQEKTLYSCKRRGNTLENELRIQYIFPYGILHSTLCLLSRWTTKLFL